MNDNLPVLREDLVAMQALQEFLSDMNDSRVLFTDEYSAQVEWKANESNSVDVNITQFISTSDYERSPAVKSERCW